MSTHLINVPASPMPQSWREAIAAARKKHSCEMAVHDATTILNGLARTETRMRRLRGLARRLAAAKRVQEIEAAKEKRRAAEAARPKQQSFDFEAPPPAKRRGGCHTLTA